VSRPVQPPLVLLLAIASALAACQTVNGQPEGAARTRERTCRERFADCAPPGRFDERTDASALDLRRQVEASLRMDAPERVSRDAAKLVLGYVQGADLHSLLRLAAIHEDAWGVLGRCQCPGEQNAWDRQQVGQKLAARLPSAELRAPKTWEDRMVARLATLRDLQRKMALRGVAGDSADDLEAERRKTELELCEAVHGARTNLLPDAYADVVEAVRRRRDAEAGPTSAEVAQQAIRGYEGTKTCEVAAPVARPAPSPARPTAPAPDEDDEE
jgi:hypothetical protein